MPETTDRTDRRRRVSVVLVEPQYAGNVGFAARVMLNFGVDRLVLVNPTPMTGEGRDRAVHAQRVLNEAIVVDTWQEAYDLFDYVAAFTARVAGRDRYHARIPIPLRELGPLVHEIDGEIALVFGREDNGLPTEAVAAADVGVQIPTDPGYSSMNLSHAIAVALYETYHEPEVVRRTIPASHHEKEVLFRHFEALIDTVRIREHKQDLHLQAIRRIVGRAGLSRWEFHRVMGVVSKTLKALGHWPVEGVPQLPPEEDEDSDGEGADVPPGTDR